MENTGNPKQQLVEKLKSANNILLTVSTNPSVDQLAACIGLTLILNKLDKHATAVFSGEVPSTMEFLRPEDTLEQNTDSLRDFIIALDKSKADKLRYKVEDKVVKIFITPYRTSISQNDLEFSQGDFNVDVVVALGVREQAQLDQAITAHGRILHDATVTSINTAPDGGLGVINWHNAAASSLSEMVEDLGADLAKDLLDEQIATALLTGIVAETDRFSNEKTSASTMKASAVLMAAGANQQLVATKLQEQLAPPEPEQPPAAPEDENSSGSPTQPPKDQPPKPDDGTLEISHDREAPPVPPAPSHEEEQPHEQNETPNDDIDEILSKLNQASPDASATSDPSRPLAMEPPQLGGTLTANSRPEQEIELPANPLALPEVENKQPLLGRDRKVDEAITVAPEKEESKAEPKAVPKPPKLPEPPIPPLVQSAMDDQDTDEQDNNQTLTSIEEAVHSPHVEKLEDARSAVSEALQSGPETDLPKSPGALDKDLGALPLGDELHDEEEAKPQPEPEPQPGAAETTPQAEPSHEVLIDEEGNFRPVAPEPISQPPTQLPAAEIHEPAPGEDLSPASRPLDMPMPSTFPVPPPMPGPSPEPANPNAAPPSPPPFMLPPTDPGNFGQ